MREQVKSVIADSRVQHAFRFIAEHESLIEADQIRLTLIPAPPFGERPRADAFSEELRKIGLTPSIDEVGNVIAAFEDFGSRPLVIGAHLDTVFPHQTPLELRRRDKALFLPGISDNGCGLVALLWTLRAARAVGLRFQKPVIAVADVGEEGEGNLRGIRHIFQAAP